MMARFDDAAAELLQEFSDLLAISGGDTFRVRAYERARAVAECPAEIADLDESGLDAIRGVRGHLAHKGAELRDTGSVAEPDKLRAMVPAGLRALSAVRRAAYAEGAHQNSS